MDNYVKHHSFSFIYHIFFNMCEIIKLRHILWNWGSIFYAKLQQIPT